MKKRIPSLVLALALIVSLMAACAPQPAQVGTAPNEEGTNEAGTREVVLTMGSWRTDDVDQMNALLAEYKTVAPNVTINFRPTNPPDYNATLRLQLDGGTGPDLMYARSYATGQELFKEGFFADCSDIPGLKDNFTASNLEPWQMPDGKMFAVPFAAVSHAVYYNKDIFSANNVAVPKTWSEFMDVCKTLKNNGVTPFANGVADEWDILECFFLGMLPNYVGGAEQRALFEKGERKFTDQAIVDAFTDLAMVSGYMPNGFEAVTYDDSMALFESGRAAMFVDGSWTCGVYSDAAFEWGLFAVPARNANDTAICFHPDMAITMNAATGHPDECRAFLQWLCSQAGATTASKALPLGFFPMIKFSIALDDPHANEFLALNEGKQTDARFVWPAMMGLYKPMNDAVIEVLRGSITPQQAAEKVEASPRTSD